MTYKLFLFLAGVIFSLTVTASSYDLLLDVSGSMRGFQHEGLQKKTTCTKTGSDSGESWKLFLGGIDNDTKKVCVFGDNYRCLQKISPYNICLKDNKTDLAGALASWLKKDSSYQNLLIITDNVADTSSSYSLQNQYKFENLLSGAKSQFSHISIIALRLPFDGLVYHLGLNKSRSQYKGLRALVIYVLSKKGVTDASFEEYRKTIEEKLTLYEYKLFPIRPFSTRSVKQNFGAVSFKNEKSNKLNIKPAKLKNGGTALKISNYSLGDRLNFSFNTGLEIQGAFTLKDINLKARIQFEGLPNHLQSKGQSQQDVMFNAKITPSEITLSPNKIQGFKIAFNMDRFSFTNIPFKKKIDLLLSNSENLKGRLDLIFTVTKEQYEPDVSVFEEWTHHNKDQLGESDRGSQAKVYNLHKILSSGIAHEETEENLKSIPIILKVRFPSRPLILLVLLIIILLGTLWWIVVKVRGNQSYTLEDDMGRKTPISIGIGHTYIYYDDRSQNLFTLRFIGFAYFVTTDLTLKGPRILSSGQSFNIFDNEDSQYSFYLQQEHAHDAALTEAGSENSYDW